MNSTDLRSLIAYTDPKDVFGADPLDQKKNYRKLVRQLHPDSRGKELDPKLTHDAFLNVEALWHKLQSPTAVVKDWTLDAKKHSYHVKGDTIHEDDIANEYEVTYQESTGDPDYDKNMPVLHGRLRMPRNPSNNDLMDAEVHSLKKLATEQTDELFIPYYPQIIESLRHRDSNSGKVRRSVVLDEYPKGLIPLSEVRPKFSNGIDPKHVAWMFRRLLTALIGAHEVGLVYGAVLPQNVWIQPAQHGLVLHNWGYSVEIGNQMKAMVKPMANFYPDEVTSKKRVGPETDTYMAVKLMQWLIGDNQLYGTDGAHPDRKRLRTFIKGCTQARASSAYELLGDFNKLIEDLWGPRKFRVFTVPA